MRCNLQVFSPSFHTASTTPAPPFLSVNRLQCRRSSGSCLAPSRPTSGNQPQEGKPGLRFRRRSGKEPSLSLLWMCLTPPNTHDSFCRPRFARWRPRRQSHVYFWRARLEKRTIEEEETCRWKPAWQLGPSVPSGDAVYHRTTNLLNFLIHQSTQWTSPSAALRLLSPFKTCQLRLERLSAGSRGEKSIGMITLNLAEK